MKTYLEKAFNFEKGENEVIGVWEYDATDSETLLIRHNGIERKYRVETIWTEYTYQLLKTKIKAMQGAKRLVEWMNKTSYFYTQTILHYCWNEMKEKGV